MKAFLHLFLATALLLQGALALAMPVTMDSPPSARGDMPCHQAAQAREGMQMDKAAHGMSCCDDGSDANCHAPCSAAVLPMSWPPAIWAAWESRSVIVRFDSTLAAHRAAPLRPPISRSA